MKSKARSASFLTVVALPLLFALALGPAGCQEAVWVFPQEGSVQEGPFDVQVFWSPEMVASTLRVAMNDHEITGSHFRASAGEGFRGMMVQPRPGRKLLSAQLRDSTGVPFGATAIFTATSTADRQNFAGGPLRFECEDSFLNSPIQIPGFDLSLGLSEKICRALPIIGWFPSGDASFPVDSGPLPVLFGIFPKPVSYDKDPEIANGISLSPVELGLTLDFDPDDPAQEGRVCRASFVMAGTILPGEVSDDGMQGPAVMVQSLREVSLSVVSGGVCEHRFTSPGDVDIMTFNYVARN